MKVILEAQRACDPNPRGIPHYYINLISSLLERRRYDYGITFFDQYRERNNRQYISKYFGNYRASIYECNSLSYRKILDNDDVFKEKSYNYYTGASGDVFHFMHIYPLPEMLAGTMVVTIHDMIPIRHPECCPLDIIHRFERVIKRIKKKQPLVVADSVSAKEDIAYYLNYESDRVYVVPLAHGSKCYPENNEAVLNFFGIDAPYLLYLGAINDPRKGVKNILEAFKSISEKHTGIKLVLAGDATGTGGTKTVADTLKDYCFRERVICTGFVTEEQKRALLSSATAFVFPSYYEGFGLPILEAMACGAPVITTNISSLPEVAGDAAILVKPNDTEQLSYELERVIDSESLRETLKQKGIEQSAKFSWDKTAQMTEDVYEIAYRS